ncbi:response regulator [Cognatishimia activa]|uniref:KDP operon transcriptional regulatory protein KdpE n=1 Tax=Cognatishimia activa TaxID=1715691 RepID=A0A0P1ISB7_9RHOB|nr:response regulator [Cognatishimia activa]MEE2943641.1 response regulator [Pseudomonadota bacterium]CUI66731.1 KDP operon transcriptional regulatory protein KdpE [Cognatishimia activa]CUK26457.1 KDP operon transcriptional regulatory protein KdpE [Cognatishimia activa]
MEDFNTFMTNPTPARPLLGLTVLAVEDSRFASEALRLICLKSGARIRRADCVASARRHLRVYRPSIAIIDLGLPDGSGLDLIRDLNRATPRVDVLLAISGDPHLAHAARSAGADRFVDKPLTSVAEFQNIILSHLPRERVPNGPRAVPKQDIKPDPIAYIDDLAHASDMLGDGMDRKSVAYVAQFLSGVARSADDNGLARASDLVLKTLSDGKSDRSCVSQLAGLMQDRMDDRKVV